jgi:hypothetical protein
LPDPHLPPGIPSIAVGAPVFMLQARAARRTGAARNPVDRLIVEGTVTRDVSHGFSRWRPTVSRYSRR